MPAKVIALGTSAGVPTRQRNVSSLVVSWESRWVMFDCGEGTQYRLMQTPLKWDRMEAVLISHLHGDHVYGLPGLLSTLGMRERSAPLAVYGPPGLRALLEATLGDPSESLPFRLDIVESEGGFLHRGKGYRIESAPLDHRVPTLGFAVIEDPSPGKFHPERAGALGVPPGPAYAALKSGKNWELPGRRIICSTEVTDEPRPGQRIVYCCDTRPCDSSVKLARGADLLIHEATYLHELERLALERGHSTAAHAAEIARAAEACRLLLTHFSPRYTDTGPLLEEARRIFPASEAAEDLAEFDLHDSQARAA